jgi:hypothetical protein
MNPTAPTPTAPTTREVAPTTTHRAETPWRDQPDSRATIRGENTGLGFGHGFGHSTPPQAQTHTVRITQDGTTLWSGTYTEKPQETNTKAITVLCKDHDHWPMILCAPTGKPLRELNKQEAQRVFEEAVVSHATMRHPAQKGQAMPVWACNIPEIWKAAIGTMGWKPAKELTLAMVETTSTGEAVLEVEVPKALAHLIEGRTQMAMAAYNAQTQEESREATTHPLGSLTEKLAALSYNEVEGALTQGKGILSRSEQEVCEIKGFLEARRTINAPLDDLRRQAADELLAAADFGQFEATDADNWTSEGNRWSTTVHGVTPRGKASLQWEVTFEDYTNVPANNN